LIRGGVLSLFTSWDLGIYTKNKQGDYAGLGRSGAKYPTSCGKWEMYSCGIVHKDPQKIGAIERSLQREEA
jgi:hypothetical protein